MNNKKPEISVAPMMDWTDRHCRYFHRLLAPNTLLYTEMVTSAAILHGDQERLLGFNPEEHPVALQLGGSEAEDLARAAKIGAEYGYDEINLNCGCPSDRVQKGRFGACLMAEPHTVADGIKAMIDATSHKSIPITVKCRIGIDEMDSYQFLADFIGTVSEAGCKRVIIHARKAWLHGLSPKENREIPPLEFERVYAIKENFPHLGIILNGGVGTIEDIKKHLHYVDGIMIGRRAYQDPWFLVDIEKEIFGNMKTRSREEIVMTMITYAQKQNAEFGTPLKSITRHILGLFHAQPGGKKWRQILSTKAYEQDASPELLETALNTMVQA